MQEQENDKKIKNNDLKASEAKNEDKKEET